MGVLAWSLCEGRGRPWRIFCRGGSCGRSGWGHENKIPQVGVRSWGRKARKEAAGVAPARLPASSTEPDCGVGPGSGTWFHGSLYVKRKMVKN